MATPLRGTQSLVGQMGWVFDRPSLTVIEVGWRWIFGIPFLAVCWIAGAAILAALPLESAGLNAIDPQNPWVAAVQLAHAWALYSRTFPRVLRWLAPVAALAWVVVSALGRSLVLRRIDPELRTRLPLRPLPMMVLQAGWLALLGATWGHGCAPCSGSRPRTSRPAASRTWWASFWVIFLSLGFFTHGRW
jgi:hypothetical protein